jgi:hypothetical protein
MIALAFLPAALIFLAASVRLSNIQNNNARLNAKYRRESNLEAERQECVNFIVNHGSSITGREPYEVLVKKMDGKNVALDESILRSRQNALAHARKRIREINAELGNNLFAFFAKEPA